MLVYVVGVNKVKKLRESEGLDLAGHAPIELSRLLAGFLAASKTNFLMVKVRGKRTREVVVPGCFPAKAKRKKFST